MPLPQMEIQQLFSDLLFVAWDARFLWLPVVLGGIFWKLWIHYIHARFIHDLNWTLLEIKLPREIAKSPKAMEMVLNGLHITSDGNFLEKYWKGKLRAWFSLEIVGIDGQIHFFVHTQKFFKKLVESQIYAQYPDVEIVEVDDYTKFSLADNFDDEWSLWGTEFLLTKKDAYPIRTYIDYGLHETMTKEEQKTDPMTAFLELLGSLKRGEQIWFQIMIRATKKNWKDEAKALVDEIMKRDEKAPAEGERINMGALMLSPGERDVVQAIERDVSKLGFDTGIRAIYLAKRDSFNGINIPSMIGIMKQYNDANLNGFRPNNTTSVDYFFKQSRESKLKKIMIDAFRQRSYFYTPYERKSFVLNTEELATIYHFPGKVAETPTFGRIEARKSEPPAGLPV